MRYHLAHQDGYDFFKKQRNKCWNIAAENRKWFYTKKTILAIAPKVKRKVNLWFNINSTTSYISQELKTVAQTNPYTWTPLAALFIIATR